MSNVKICGLTNLDDAVVAAEAGADFLGFILYPPSKRAVDRKAVQCIVSHLRSLEHCPTLVGVFVNESADYMASTLDFCDLDLAQLHGNEVPSMIGDSKSPLFERSYKALRPQTAIEAEAEAEWYVPPTDDPLQPQILVDAWHPNLYGGTGEVSDWEIARVLLQKVPRLMLAGGLTPDNVAQAVREVQPWAVDVASGVEAEPGRKDHDAVRRFVAAAKGVE